jgi:hypothetical protein
MARSDYAALLTEPAAEYVACSELQRFGLDPYLPQIRRRHRTPAGKFLLRRFPLFPRYLLIPINSAHDPVVRMTRGICRHRPLLADEDGRPWRAPNHIIDAVRMAERVGFFDEILHKGDQVTFACGVLANVRAVMTADATPEALDLLVPLLGGARVKVSPERVSLTKQNKGL